MRFPCRLSWHRPGFRSTGLSLENLCVAVVNRRYANIYYRDTEHTNEPQRIRPGHAPSALVHAFPAKVQYNDRARTDLMLEGKRPYWKSPIWNVSVGTAGFFAT